MGGIPPNNGPWQGVSLNSSFENTCSSGGEPGIKHDPNHELNNCNPEVNDVYALLILKEIQEYFTKEH